VADAAATVGTAGYHSRPGLVMDTKPGLIERLAGGGILFAIRHLVRELRGIRLAVETLTDTVRLVNQLPTVYQPIEAAPPLDDTDSFVRSGDFLSAWLIEELAAEYFVRVSERTDLAALAEDRGWVKDGQFVMLPKAATAAGLTLDDVNATVGAGAKRGG